MISKSKLYLLLSAALVTSSQPTLLVAAPGQAQPVSESVNYSNAALAGACVAGGTLAFYGLYKWLYASSTWSTDVIKKETKELLDTAAFGKLKYPVIWDAKPLITPNLARNKAKVVITAKANTGERTWVIDDVNVTESDNPRDLSPDAGVSLVNWCLIEPDLGGGSQGFLRSFKR